MRVDQDEGVLLGIGDQQLHLPWSDLVLRLESWSGIAAEENVRLAIDTDRLLLFGKDWQRVDPVQR